MDGTANPTAPLADTIHRGALPDALPRVLERGVAAAIWDRTRDPDMGAWLDALPPDQLPQLRATVSPNAMAAAVLACCDMGGTPDSPERATFASDVALLARIFGAVMGTDFLETRLAVVRGDACRRFHLDRMRARLICTYRGPGTDYGRATLGTTPDRIDRVPTGAPAIFRGALWRGEECGVLHRSPSVAGQGIARLVLVLDAAGDWDPN